MLYAIVYEWGISLFGKFFMKNFWTAAVIVGTISKKWGQSWIANSTCTFVAFLSYCPTYLSMIALWNLLYEFQCLEWILMLEMNFSDYNLEFRCLQWRISVLTIYQLVPKSKPYELKTSLTLRQAYPLPLLI